MTFPSTYTYPGPDTYPGVPVRPVWPHDIRLLVRIPDPDQVRGRLGVSSLGTMRLHTMDPRTMVLGTGRLGTGRIAPVMPDVIWWDLTPWCAVIDASHGSQTDPAGTPEPGRLDVTLDGLPRLIELGITTGTRIQLLHEWTHPAVDGWPAYTDTLCLWSGRIEDVTETHFNRNAGGHHDEQTTITAYDVIRELAAITRYGSQGGGTAMERFEAMASQTGGIGTSTASGPGGDAPAVNSIHSTDLVAWLTICAASAGALWRVTYLADRDPLLRLETWDAWAGTVPLATFTDRALVDSYYRCDVSAGGRSLWSQIDATVHGIAADGNASQTVISRRDVSKAAAMGVRAAAVDVITDPSAAPAMIDRLLARTGDPHTPTVTALEIDGRDCVAWRGTRGAFAPPLRPLAPVRVLERGRRHDLIVAAMRHVITPRRWRTTLTTMPSPVPLAPPTES